MNSKKNMAIEMLVDAKAIVGEGPVWDEKIGKLYWLDIISCLIHRYDPASQTDEQVNVGQMVGAVAVRRDGTLIAALTDGFYTVNFETGAVEPVWQTAKETGNRFNDGKCDPDGRFWAGTMSMNGDRDTGSLYLLDTGRKVHHLLGGIYISNGLAWSADRRTVYYIDTGRREIWSFDYDPTGTALANKKTVVRIAAGEGFPDGMTIDAEDRLWVAQWGGSRVCCYDPRDGRKLREILFPVEQVSSCTFGGPNLDELYVTTALNRLSEEALRQQPLAGALFRVKTDTCGRTADRYLDIVSQTPDLPL